MQARYRRDTGEIQARYRRDTGEMQARCSGEISEIKARYMGDTGERGGLVHLRADGAVVQGRPAISPRFPLDLP